MDPSARPSPFQRFIGAPFFAGLLGAGVLLWALGLVALLSDAGIVEGSRDTLMVLSFVAAVYLGMARGYTTPIVSYPALLGRLAGALFLGFVLAVGGVAVVETVVHGSDRRTLAITLLGALFAGLAVARLHGRRVAEALRADVATRWKAGAGAAVIALGVAWCASAGVRCQLGDGASCRAAGGDAGDEGDDPRAVELFQRGCAQGDAVSCRLAAFRVRRGDPQLAEDLLREGCLRGDPAACGRIHALRLEQRCDGYSASACRQLAEAYARGDDVSRDPSASSRLFHKACLLGDEQACQR